MKTNEKRIYLTHHELLKTISIVQAVKYAAARRRNKAEIRLMNELLNKLLDFDIDCKGVLVALDSMSRCTLWTYVEQYINFCVEVQQHAEYVLAVDIATKLSN